MKRTNLIAFANRHPHTYTRIHRGMKRNKENNGIIAPHTLSLSLSITYTHTHPNYTNTTANRENLMFYMKRKQAEKKEVNAWTGM